MLQKLRFLTLLAVVVCVPSLQAAGISDSLKKGTPDLKSATALAFGLNAHREERAQTWQDHPLLGPRNGLKAGHEDL